MLIVLNIDIVTWCQKWDIYISKSAASVDDMEENGITCTYKEEFSPLICSVFTWMT